MYSDICYTIRQQDPQIARSVVYLSEDEVIHNQSGAKCNASDPFIAGLLTLYDRLDRVSLLS